MIALGGNLCFSEEVRLIHDLERLVLVYVVMTMPLHNQTKDLAAQEVAGAGGSASILDRHKSAMLLTQSIHNNEIMNKFGQKNIRSKRGFSLLEMMAVMIIMSVMLALSAPALSSFRNTVGRKGAINQLLNSFEQARVAALTQGTKIYVGFADSSSQFPDNMKCKAYIVFRERFDDEPATPKYIPLTKWLFLPEGIALQKMNSDQSTLMSNNNLFKVDMGCLPIVSKSSDINLPVLAFNSSGYIDQPTSQYLRLLIYEGFQGPNGPSFTNPANTQFDVIAFRRFSGRAELFLAGR